MVVGFSHSSCIIVIEFTVLGTHVSGVIAASRNGYGVQGVGDFHLLIVRGLGDDGRGFESDIYEAVKLCVDSKADVINLSLGSSLMSNFSNELYTEVVEKHGIVMVAAAGNDGDTTKYFPASHPAVISVGAVSTNGQRYFSSNFNDQVEFAAPGQDVLSTTVSTNAIKTDEFSYPANTVLGTLRSHASGNLVECYSGSTEDIEPGDICFFGIFSHEIKGRPKVEDLVVKCFNAGGIGTVIYDNSLGMNRIPNFYAQSDQDLIPSVSIAKGDAYQILEVMDMKGGDFRVQIGAFEDDQMAYAFATLSGTSMASPHVSAAFALIKSHFPECSQWQIRHSFAETALSPEGGCNAEYGYGLIQVKDAYDWLVDKGSCNDWELEEVSAGGCYTRRLRS
jgi:serine protease